MCIADQNTLAKGHVILSAAQGITGAIGSIAAGNASSNYYKSVAKGYDTQKKLNTIATDRQAELNAIAAADKSAQISRAGKQIYGAQKAAMAASGVNMASVSAQDVIKDSAAKEAQDQATLAYNLDTTNFNLRQQNTLNNINLDYEAKTARIAGSNAKTSGYLNAFNSVLSSGATVAEKWYKYKKEGLPLWG